MSPLEQLFMQIFDRKNWIIDQFNSQLDSYDQTLVCYLLANGIAPPSWLLGAGSDVQNTDFTVLKKDINSGILFPAPVAPLHTNGKIRQAGFELDQSLLRDHRYGSTQTAKGLGSRAKTNMTKHPHKEDIASKYTSRFTRSRSARLQANNGHETLWKEDIASKYTGRVTRSRSARLQANSGQEPLGSENFPGPTENDIITESRSPVQLLNCRDGSFNLATLGPQVGRDELGNALGTQFRVLHELAFDSDSATCIDAYNFVGQQISAAKTRANDLIPDVPFATLSTRSSKPMAALDNTLSSPSPNYSSYIEPKQLDFDNMEEYNLNQCCSAAVEKEVQDICSETRVVSKSALALEKDTVMADVMKNGEVSQAYADAVTANERDTVTCGVIKNGVDAQPYADGVTLEKDTVMCDVIKNGVDSQPYADGVTANELVDGELPLRTSIYIEAEQLDAEKCPNTKAYFEPKQIDSDDLEECSLNQFFNEALGKEKVYNFEEEARGVSKSGLAKLLKEAITCGDGEMHYHDKDGLMLEKEVMCTSEVHGQEEALVSPVEECNLNEIYDHAFGQEKEEQVDFDDTGECSLIKSSKQGSGIEKWDHSAEMRPITELGPAVSMKGKTVSNKDHKVHYLDTKLMLEKEELHTIEVVNGEEEGLEFFFEDQAMERLALVQDSTLRKTPEAFGVGVAETSQDSNYVSNCKSFLANSVSTLQENGRKYSVEDKLQTVPYEARYHYDSVVNPQKISVPDVKHYEEHSRMSHKVEEIVIDACRSAHGETETQCPVLICNEQLQEAQYFPSSAAHSNDTEPFKSDEIHESSMAENVAVVISSTCGCTNTLTATPCSDHDSFGHQEPPCSSRSMTRQNKDISFYKSSETCSTKKSLHVVKDRTVAFEISWPMYKKRKTESRLNNVFYTSPRIGRSKPLQQICEANFSRCLLSPEGVSVANMEPNNLSLSSSMCIKHWNLDTAKAMVDMQQSKKFPNKEGSEKLTNLKLKHSPLQVEVADLELKGKGQGGSSTAELQHREVEIHLDMSEKKQADVALHDCLKDRQEIVGSVSSLLDVTRLCTLDDDMDLQERVRSPLQKEGNTEEKKSHCGEYGIFSSCYSVRSTREEDLEAGADATLPELSCVNVTQECKSPIIVKDEICFGKHVNVPEQLFDSAILPHFHPRPSEIQTLPDVCSPLPKSLLEQIDLSFLFKESDSRQTVGLADVTLSEGRSYSCTPPVGKLCSESSASSLEKHFSTCFRIDEEISINGEICNLNEEVTPGKAIGSREQTFSLERKALTNFTSSYNKSSVLVSETANFEDRGSIHSLNTEINLDGAQFGAKSLEYDYGQEQRYKKDDEGNQSYSTDGNYVREPTGSLCNRFHMPKFSGKISETREGQNFMKTGCKPNNIVSNIASFIPLVQQKKQPPAILTGKRDVKVKSLEAAEAAKRLEEERENARKMRKQVAKIEREKMEHENVKQLEMKKKRKVEERRKKEADIAARKRQRDEERKEKERKRRCIEEARMQQIEREKQLRVKEEKEIGRKAAEQQKRRALAAETRKLQKLEKIKEAGNKKLTELEQKTAKAMTGDARQPSSICENHVGFEKPDYLEEVVNDLDYFSKPNEDHFSEIQGGEELQSYDISPFQSSDDEEEEHIVPERKIIPQWAREKHLSRSLKFLELNPDDIFLLERSCGVNQVVQRRT